MTESHGHLTAREAGKLSIFFIQSLQTAARNKELRRGLYPWTNNPPTFPNKSPTYPLCSSIPLHSTYPTATRYHLLYHSRPSCINSYQGLSRAAFIWKTHASRGGTLWRNTINSVALIFFSPIRIVLKSTSLSINIYTSVTILVG